MTFQITLELGDAELDYFRSVMRRVSILNESRTPEDVALAATREVDRLRATARSPFIRKRIERVARLIAMLQDAEWQLPDFERRRVLGALAYVAEAHDLVPDNVPVLGLLDDAIMLELVLRDVQPEIDAYEDFDAYRQEQRAAMNAGRKEHDVSRQDWLDSRREALHERMSERRLRDLAWHGGEFDLITHF